jgi:hypothetical protein
MLSAMPTAPQSNSVVTTWLTALGAAIALNVAFYVLSMSYFESHTELVNGVLAPSYSPDQMTKVRIAFAVFSAVVAAAGAIAALQPRRAGHVLAALFGVLDLVAAIRGLSVNMPGVIVVTLVLAGVLLLVLTSRSYFHQSRAAWSVIVAICGVFAICELFGVPKIARGLEVSLWLAMISPGLKVVATFALVSLRNDYADPDVAAA